MKAFRRLFSNLKIPTAPVILFVNEAGIVVWDPDNKDYKSAHCVFEASDTESSSIAKALKWVFKRRLDENDRYISVVLGGKHSLTQVVDQNDTNALLGSRTSMYDNGLKISREIITRKVKGKKAREYVELRSFNADIVELIRKISLEYRIHLISIEPLSSVLSRIFENDPRIVSTIGIKLPFEAILVERSDNGILNIVSEVGDFSSDKLFALLSRCANTLSLSDFLSAVRGKVKTLIGEVSIFQSYRKAFGFVEDASLRYKSKRQALRFGRIAFALSFVLAISGIAQTWQRTTTSEADEELASRIEKRDELRESIRELDLTNSKIASFAVIKPSVFLSRLAQDKTEGVILVSAEMKTGENFSEDELSLSGTAQNEAQVFSYSKLLGSYFPGHEMSLVSLSDKNTRRASEKERLKVFKLKVITP